MRICLTQYAGIDAVAGLPLAAGILVATAKRDRVLSTHCTFSICVDRLPLTEAVSRLSRPDVLGLSLYPWNAAYTLALAAEARRAYPEAVIVAGGPAVPRRPKPLRDFMDQNPAVDILVLGEGELVFRDLLRAIRAGADLSDVPALVLRKPDGLLLATGPEVRVQDFSQTGSPYLDGTFDALIASHPNRFAMALFETNRGCPFSCTFCDWSTTKQVVEYPLERVLAELDWAAARHYSNLCITDANFGIRQRDKAIAEHLATLRLETGHPSFCFFYLTKNDHLRNLQTIDIFQQAGIDHCVGLAVQDFDKDVLIAVKRDNIQSRHTLSLGKICADRGIRTHNELILGLPRQTYDSFVTTVLTAMPGHPRHEFHVYACRLIDNTELAAPATRERYGIETRRCRWLPTNDSWDPIVEEFQEIIIATVDMPVADWRRTNRFANYAGAAYNCRLLRNVLRLLDEQGLDRRTWLERLCGAMAEGSGHAVHERMGRAVEQILDSILDGDRLALPLEGLGDGLFEMLESIAVVAFCDLDAFYAEVHTLTRDVFGDALAEDLLAELMRFEALGVARHESSETRTETFEHDWLSWANSSVGASLKRRPVTISFTPPAYTGVDALEAFIRFHLAVGSAGASTGQLTSTERPARLTTSANLSATST